MARDRNLSSSGIHSSCLHDDIPTSGVRLGLSSLASAERLKAVTMDPVEALKWAGLVTTALGGGALGIKKLLTIWGKESAQSSGVSAANDIINSLRSEVESSRKNAKHFSLENEELMIQKSELQKQVANLRNVNNKLTLNNRVLLNIVRKNNILVDANLTFSDTDVGGLH
jgi:hypothetical protein